MEGFQHRIGGLEKDVNGNVSHDPANHQRMCEIRRDKVEAVVDMVPDLKILGAPTGDLLVVGWGGTLGHLDSAVRELSAKGAKNQFWPTLIISNRFLPIAQKFLPGSKRLSFVS